MFLSRLARILKILNSENSDSDNDQLKLPETDNFPYFPDGFWALSRALAAP
jgi:hypothetical protein